MSTQVPLTSPLTQVPLNPSVGQDKSPDIIKDTKGLGHKYTNTQIQKYSNTQIQKYRNTRIYKYKYKSQDIIKDANTFKSYN